MEKYIEGNKAAWEEAFENRDASWGADITERIRKESYPFFNEETREVLKRLDAKDAVIGQFCCNNGRELLSLVKCGGAAKGIGFDIAENQVAFANEKAKELDLPCFFEAVNIYDIDDRYKEMFDIVIITIGALCWFQDLDRFFAVVAKCMKPGAVIVINEQHPCTNMLATDGEELFDPDHRLECHYSYFEHEWTGNEGMYYITQKSYHSKTFTDYTHSLSEIISGMCKNGMVITGLQEFDHDISGGFSEVDHKGYPLSMIIQGRKTGNGQRERIASDEVSKKERYPSREEAERLLKEAEGCNPGPWGNHSRTAAHCAGAIAERSGMNAEKAYVLGLLHDIGRKFGKRHLGHVSDGYSYMMSLGYDDVARICLTHSFNEKDISKYVGNFDTTEEETTLIKDGLEAIELDDYDRLIQLCDSISGAEGVMDQIERMTDVKTRYGAYDQQKWDANIKLREYFEDRMGADLYAAVDKENYKPE